jgi:chromosome partitioning protein
MKQTKIITVANHKGGVGKTTTVASISSLLAHAGLNVLMVDLDAQCSLTESFVVEEPETTVYDAFLNPKRDWSDMVIEVRENLHLLPSSVLVSDLDMMLAAKTQNEKYLLKILKNMNVNEKYDVIFLDCSPSLGLITTNALVAADELYVPTMAEIMPLRGLKKLEMKIEEIAEELNPGLKISGIIVTRHNRSKNLNNSVLEALREIYGNVVFDTVIRENIKLAETPQFKKDIVEYAPESNGAKDYVALTQEILDRIAD